MLLFLLFLKNAKKIKIMPHSAGEYKIKTDLIIGALSQKVNGNFLDVLGNLPKTYKLDKPVDSAYTNPGARGRFWQD